jgi:hypothetical protein
MGFSCVIPSKVRNRDTFMKTKELLKDILYFALMFFILFCLFSCEYRYRYPCQDPDNWHKEECNNKACEVEGTCTEQVLAKK